MQRRSPADPPSPEMPRPITRAPPPPRRPRPGGPAPSPGPSWAALSPQPGPREPPGGEAPARPAPRPPHGGAPGSASWVGAAPAAAAGRRSRRCSGARSPATPGTRDGGAAVQRPPAAGRLRAGEVTPRAERAGRIRGGRGGSGNQAALRGEGRGRSHHLCALTAPTSNFLKLGSDATQPALVGACRRELCKGFSAAGPKNAP